MMPRGAHNGPVEGTKTYCPSCDMSTDNNVKDSRPAKWREKYDVVRRRRSCNTCGARYTTLEIPWNLLDDYALRIEAIDNMLDVLQTMREDIIREAQRKRRLEYVTL